MLPALAAGRAAFQSGIAGEIADAELVGMSSRLRKAYVAAKFYELAHRWARARHSEAAAACSSGESG
jgi:hypothetical protein